MLTKYTKNDLADSSEASVAIETLQQINLHRTLRCRGPFNGQLSGIDSFPKPDRRVASACVSALITLTDQWDCFKSSILTYFRGTDREMTMLDEAA